MYACSQSIVRAVIHVNGTVLTKFKVTSFIHSKDMTGAPKFLKRVMNETLIRPLLGVICHPKANS